MKTLFLIFGSLLTLTLAACGPAFTAGFSESGSRSGDAGEAGEAGAPDAAGEAGAAGDEVAARAGAPVSQAGTGSVLGGAGAGPEGGTSASAGAGAPAGGASGAGAPSFFQPPCEATDDLSGHFVGSFVSPGGGECWRTKETFNVLRMNACTPARDVRINGGPALHCTMEASTVWSSGICSIKGNFSATDADGFRYLQFGADEYACGPFIWSTEPTGEPCSNPQGFAYDKSTEYRATDRVTAPCEDDSSKTCAFRCADSHCSGVSTPKAPKWELIRSCGA